MSLLPILRYPDPRLNKVAEPVTVFDEQLKTLVADMAQTMYDAPGIGLAAPQVDVHRQVIVIDISEDRNTLQVFINPEIVTASAEKAPYDEGCLSVPGIYEEVERPARVTVRAQDVNGKFFDIQAEGLMAVCLQHEIDHLKGFMFVDYLSQLKRNRIKTRMLKEEREKKREKTSQSGKKR
ncbi:peptide deformylase [Oxalobacter vibrioformis]|uniref:Peptide deformylase n=1 Tax=Oxalobacter vibrioformis TaxID=933080 RepID=A0A9E9LXH6_9BURK|nr:peptide deformylase [Oxalobacter vibrioformis]WAW11076.1 peptide deformylase [Oxalobacter vibrioformis]